MFWFVAAAGIYLATWFIRVGINIQSIEDEQKRHSTKLGMAKIFGFLIIICLICGVISYALKITG